jgi:Leucine-rich repeat (LRR) protein
MKYALGAIAGTALLGLVNAKSGDRNSYGTKNIEDIYNLSAQKKAQITKLYLSTIGLTRIPDDIFDGFTKLEWLSFSENQLTELPQSIGTLTNLKELYLNDNQLTVLPNSISNLTNLEYLVLNDNQLTELPDSIGNLTKLKGIYLGDNELTKLPESIGNLTNLEELGLDKNQLSELPQSIGNLTKLTWLGLERNNWKKPVPKQIIFKMIRNRVPKNVIEQIIEMNNSITTKKSNLRTR